MAIQPTYPGVYIEEIPSGVRTITGVSTSITAFIGRALKGPVDEPTTINSFGDYERQFGGLWADSTMSYAVRDFYRNGGSQAIIVRITHVTESSTETDAPAITASIDLDTSSTPLTLYAKSPGKWGNSLSVEVNHLTDDPTVAFISPPEPDPNLFNLIIYVDGDKKEEYLNVTLQPNEVRFLPRILEQSSELLEAKKDVNGKWVDIPTNQSTVVESKTVTVEGSDGTDLKKEDYEGSEDNKTGIYALLNTDLFNFSLPYRNKSREVL